MNLEASSSIATHLVLGVHQLSSSMAQVSSVLNSAHLKLVGVVSKMGVAAHFFARASRAHCQAPLYIDSWTRPCFSACMNTVQVSNIRKQPGLGIWY